MGEGRRLDCLRRARKSRSVAYISLVGTPAGTFTPTVELAVALVERSAAVRVLAYVPGVALITPEM